MFYEFDAVTPVGRLEANPLKTEMKVHRGVLVKGEIMFPLGCAGVAHARVFILEHQIWPLNRTGSMKGDYTTIEIREAIEIRPGEETLHALTWNTSGRNSHTITIRLIVLPRLLAYPYLMIQGLVDSLRAVFKV